jgi:imidazolonepropionase-like amidohydrolase
MSRTLTSILTLFLAISLNATAAIKAIKSGKLWDGHRVIANAVVIIENDRVQSVTARGRIPAGAEIIDLSRYTAIPGMIDSHTHITYYWDGAPGTSPPHPGMEKSRLPAPRHVAVAVFLAQENAKRTLDAGVTTVRDLNAFYGMDIDMRDLINMGAMIGPRMFVSGTGLPDLTAQAAILYGLDPPSQPGWRKEDAAKHAQAVIDSGADWVKLFGSTGGWDDVTGTQTISYEEMKAIVDTSHASGHKVAIHCYGPACAMRSGRGAIRSNMRPTWMTTLSRKWSGRRSGMSPRSITISTMLKTPMTSTSFRLARRKI